MSSPLPTHHQTTPVDRTRHQAAALESAFAEASRFAASGEIANALAGFAEICRRWPRLAVAHANRGVLLRRSGRLVEAMEALRRAAGLAPLDSARWSQLAVAAHDAGAMPEAVEALRRSLLVTPDAAAGWYDLGVTYPLVGRRAEAAHCLGRTVRLTPDRNGAWIRLARAMARLGRARGTIENALRRALILAPDSSEANRERALLDASAEPAKRWRALAPDDAEAVTTLASRQLADGRTDAAASLLSAFLADAPQVADSGEPILETAVLLARSIGLPKAAALRTRYERWIDTVERADRDPDAWRKRIDGWTDPPVISILLPVCDPPPEILRETLRSVTRQIYPFWTLCVADDASTDTEVRTMLDAFAGTDPRVRLARRPARGDISAATNTALDLAEGAFAGFLDHDDLLAPHALAAVAEVLVEAPGLDLIYSDEDKIDRAGSRMAPHFKPGWDPDRIVAQNYVCHFCVVRTALLRRLGGLRIGLEGAQDHDLVLRLSERTAPDRIRHIPKILYHWRAIAGSTAMALAEKPYATRAGDRAAAEHLARTGRSARLRSEAGRRRILWSLPDPLPVVRAVIPTRDRIELLRRTVDGLLRRTDYQNLAVVIVDNGSVEPATERYLAALSANPNITVLDRPGPFNFSAMMNAGAAPGVTRPRHLEHAGSPGDEVLLFLNNDVEPSGDPSWLREMVGQALRPEVGPVGALLLYPDRTVQHAGVAMAGAWAARHVEVGEPDTETGDHGRRRTVQTVSAVTGACLAIRWTVFEALGGFDVEALGVDFSDIDLCLRAEAAGYRTVFTPFAKLIHHESATRGPYMSTDKRARWQREAAAMRDRWGDRLQLDPYYNPNLAIAPGQRTYTPKLPGTDQ